MRKIPLVTKLPPGKDRKVISVRTRYYKCIQRADRNEERLIEKIDKNGVQKVTLLIPDEVNETGRVWRF